MTQIIISETEDREFLIYETIVHKAVLDKDGNLEVYKVFANEIDFIEDPETCETFAEDQFNSINF